jgi:hypothetical protein
MFPRVQGFHRSQEGWQTDIDRRRILEGDDSYVRQGVAYVHLLHNSYDLGTFCSLS